MTATTASEQRSRKPALDRLRKPPQTASLRISTDGEAAEALEEAEAEVELKKLLAGGSTNEDTLTGLKKATDAYKAAKEAVIKNSIKFTFRAIGRKRFDALVNEHPPTEEQRKKAEAAGDNPEELEWDVDTFPKALTAASLVEPELTEEEFFELWDSDDWNAPELLSMFGVAMQVNTARGVVNLKKD